MLAAVTTFVRLRWRLLRGAIRHGGAEQVGAVVSTVAAIIVGIGGALGIFAATRTAARPGELATIFCTVVLLAVLGFGLVAGVAQAIDPRVVAAEPLSDRRRAAGLLAAAAFGPPGLAAAAIGFGLAAGFVPGTDGAAGVAVVVVACGSWLLSLLLLARTATNLLALLVHRFPRLGQAVVGVTGLVCYGLLQFVQALLGGLEAGDRAELAGAMRWTPPGQLGHVLGLTVDAGTTGAAALAHLVLGTVWLPVLAVAFAASERRLATSVRPGGGPATAGADATALGALVRRACGDGPAGAVAWRSLLTRFRTPRTALETFTGAGVGLAAVLAPIVLRDSPGSGAVLVGGAVQLAVLFMAGNSFGIDGPAVTHELLTGVDTTALVRGKARAIAIVAAPLAIVGPLLAAGITGEWRYLAAGFGVGVGALWAGTGAALVQSTLVPIAVPESDNPFVGGDSGKGLVAALLLVVVLGGLAIVTVPVALALFWASDRGRADLVTVLAAATVALGWAVARGGVGIATKRLRGRDPEFVASVTPAR